MLQHAFKEWAVICEALAQGQQAIILRKGGSAETDGEFRLEQQRFWLFPTFSNQQEQGVREEALPLWQSVLAGRPPAGTVRLSHFAEVTGIYRVHDLMPALMIAHLHMWSEETVCQLFEYGTPGLNVWTVRVYRALQVHDLADTAGYQECRSWVELDRSLPTDGAVPVLADKDYRDVQYSLDLLLNPTAIV